MNKCPVCKRAKCKWVELKSDPSKLSTEELKRVVVHNQDYIEMLFRGNGGSAYAEEKMINSLSPYTDELEERKERP